MNWLIYWIAALASYRMTILLSRDKISKPLRSIPYIGTLLKCPYCVSVWMGFLTTFILYLAGFPAPIFMAILLSLSFSAITIFADRFFTADYNP